MILLRPLVVIFGALTICVAWAIVCAFTARACGWWVSLPFLAGVVSVSAVLTCPMFHDLKLRKFWTETD